MEQKYDPAEIERTSMAIIERELSKRRIVLPEDHAAVVKRVIHTTADFDYVENLRFTDGAVSLALEALKNGISIVTDTNMAKAGVSISGLRKLGGEAICLMADPEVAAKAKGEGTTRAVSAMETAAARWPNAVFAVGNAPTALFQLAEEIRKGCRPSLIIAVPVGFVNVVEAKDMIWSVCQEYSIPVIVACGRKGGSTVAAAICNALIYSAAGMTDPSNR